MVITVNNGVCVALLEISLKCPIVGKAERDQCVSCGYCIEGDDVSAVICAADPRKLLTRHRIEAGKLTWIASLL